MSTAQKELLEKGQVKLTITVPFADLAPFLEDASQRLSETVQIPGFRPGKANFDVVKRHVGEMKVYEEALESVVRKTFIEALEDQKIDTVGSPAIDIQKLAPGNDLVYTATVTLMPVVEQMADYRALSVAAKSVEVKEEDVDRVVRDLQRMQTKEIRATATDTATDKDKVVVNMNLKKDNVPVEGGQAVGHSIYLNESYYIPGLIDQLIGMKEGDEKTFDIAFPESHYQKHLAGKSVTAEVAVKELYHLENPTIDDAFAQALGQKDVAALRGVLKENIVREKTDEEDARLERDMLESIAKGSRFTDVPDLLVNEEINKMIEELKRGVAEQGVEFDTYLKNIKKTLPELKVELTPQALLRIKVAIVLKDIAKKENVLVEEKELDEEIDKQAEHYQSKEAKEQIYSPIYRDYMETVVRNRKVIALLKSLMVKPA